MALIRNQQARHMAEDAIVLDLGDLRRQAKQMKQRARAEAEQIIADARAEAERLTEGAEAKGREAGYAAGYAEGLEAGRAEGHQQALREGKESLAKLEQAWVNAARQWDDERRQMVLEARQSLLELAVRMAEKVVRRVPEVEPAVVQDQVAEAVAHVTGPCDVTIEIHPEDRPLVEQALPGVVQQLSQVRHASLIEREAVGRGGCVVRHGSGRIDATLHTQLDRLVHTLLPDADVQPVQPEAGATAEATAEVEDVGASDGGSESGEVR